MRVLCRRELAWLALAAIASSLPTQPLVAFLAPGLPSYRTILVARWFKIRSLPKDLPPVQRHLKQAFCLLKDVPCVNPSTQALIWLVLN